MEITELFRLLEIPSEVEKQLIDYGRNRNAPIPNTVINKILKRDEREADLRKSSVAQSIKSFKEFRTEYYPEWADVDLTCDTWMLMPELKEMLLYKSDFAELQPAKTE